MIADAPGGFPGDVPLTLALMGLMGFGARRHMVYPWVRRARV